MCTDENKCQFIPEPVHSLPASAGSAPAPLQKQEQIKGPKNGPIARFDGLCCYQSRSKKTKACTMQTAAETGKRQSARLRAGLRRGAARRKNASRHGPFPSRCGPLLAPVSDAFHFIFRSKFKAQKTAPSHGFRGFAAIKQIAKKGFQAPGGKRRAVLAIRSCARACRPGRGAAAGCPIGLAWRHRRPEGAASRRRRRAARAPRAGHSRPGG